MRQYLRIPEFYAVLAILALLCLVALAPLPSWATPPHHEKPSKGDTVVQHQETSVHNVSESHTSAKSSVDSHDVVHGDDYEAAASSAAVYLVGCGTGASAQGMGFGAALGAESRVCQLLRVAAAEQALGMHFEAARTVRQALAEINGGAELPSESGPLVRASRWFRFQVIQPLFGWLPVVGPMV